MMATLAPMAVWFGDPPMLRVSPESDTRAQARRMSRTPTLDGGAVITDSGYSDADRTFIISLVNATTDQADAIKEIADLGLCVIGLDHGLYQGYIKDHALNRPNDARFTFWVLTKIA